jgi:hypothetical protein
MAGNSVIIPHGSGDPVDEQITSDVFWPALSTNDFRNAMRVGATIPDERVKLALIEGVLKINDELAPLKSASAQYAALADIPAVQIMGQSIKIHHYIGAVFNEAKASLTETYRDFDSTQSGHDEADKLEISIVDYRQTSREHIRKLLGKPRATIGLL